MKVLITFFIFVLLSPVASGEVFNKELADPWKQENVNYFPFPVFMYHGFSKGDQSDWNNTRSLLSLYFNKYYREPGDIFNYMRVMDFHPALDETEKFIQANGSVDDYQAGDQYVMLRDENGNPYRQPGDPGWARRADSKFNHFAVGYLDEPYQKAIMLCHSMGGLAVREMLTGPYPSDAENRVSKVITLGTPHFGSRLANLGVIQSKLTKPMFYTSHYLKSLFGLINRGMVQPNDELRDPNGDAIRDLRDPSLLGGNPFLETLNSRDPLTNKFDYYLVAGKIGYLEAERIRDLATNFGTGDAIVHVDSQLGRNRVTGEDLFSRKAEVVIQSNHSNEAKKMGDSEPDKPSVLLKLLDPEIEVDIEPLPFYSVSPGVVNEEVPLYGVIKKTLFPASTKLAIRCEYSNGTVVETLPLTEGLVYPDDSWDPTQPDEFPRGGFELQLPLVPAKYCISAQTSGHSDQNEHPYFISQDRDFKTKDEVDIVIEPATYIISWSLNKPSGGLGYSHISAIQNAFWNASSGPVISGSPVASVGFSYNVEELIDPEDFTHEASLLWSRAFSEFSITYSNASFAGIENFEDYEIRAFLGVKTPDSGYIASNDIYPGAPFRSSSITVGYVDAESSAINWDTLGVPIGEISIEQEDDNNVFEFEVPNYNFQRHPIFSFRITDETDSPGFSLYSDGNKRLYANTRLFLKAAYYMKYVIKRK